ncbi:MAG: amidohydrolase [Ruminococcaceae bacterium]|nr:amidohydrolase [Oscillospiraceae bacterium]
MNYKITGAKVLCADNEKLTIQDKDIYISGGKIVSADVVKDKYETVNASGKLMMPGLINMHTHAYMSLFRNYADDVNFDEWLFKRIMPVEETLSPHAAYISSLFNMMEMVMTGTTCFMDMHMFEGQSAKAARDMGMRGYIGRAVVGEDLYTDGKSRFEECLREKDMYESDTVKFVLSPHAIYSASVKMFTQVTEESEKRGMLRMTHLSESDNEIQNCFKAHGISPVELLDKTGFLSPKATLAHCVKFSDSDIELVAKRGANVVTNPASNCKLGNGFARINDMKKGGVNICLGTDSNASNNTQNMIREMGVMTLIHKGLACDSVAAPAEFVINCATRNGARALGMENMLGVIKEGACADLIFLDLNSPSLFPNNNILSSLCYSANGSEVESVMIDGKFVMKNREFVTVDKEYVIHELHKAVEEFL